jgi:hypothetical protein
VYIVDKARQRIPVPALRQPVETGQYCGRLASMAGSDIPSVLERTDTLHQLVKPADVVKVLRLRRALSLVV